MQRIVLIPDLLGLLSIICDVFLDIGVLALCTEKMGRMHATKQG